MLYTNDSIGINYLRIPSNELLAKSTTPETGRVTAPTRPLPKPRKLNIKKNLRM